MDSVEPWVSKEMTPHRPLLSGSLSGYCAPVEEEQCEWEWGVQLTQMQGWQGSPRARVSELSLEGREG